MDPGAPDSDRVSASGVAPEPRADPLERALVAFEANDLDAAALLDGASAVARDLGLPRLVAELAATCGPRRGRVAERIARHAAAMPESVVLDLVVGEAWSTAERHGEALEAWRAALPRTPRWHPGIAAHVLTGLGRGFVGLGRADVAIGWLERACAFDPFHPSALASFVAALVDLDDAAHAFAVADHLARAGFDAALSAPLAGLARPADVPPFTPDLSLLRPLDDVGWARLVAALAFAPALGAPGERAVESLRVHALGCAMRGRFAYAAMSARAAEAVVDAPAIELAWSRSLAAACAARAGLAGEETPSFDPASRLAALRGAIDPTRLRDALHDPAVPVRLFAARRLFEGNGDDELAAALIDVQATIERDRALDLHPTGELGATATAIARARALQRHPSPSPRVLPEEGAAHPTFARVRPSEAIVAWIEHREPIADAASLDRMLDHARPMLQVRTALEIRVQAEVVELVARDLVGDVKPLVAALCEAMTARGVATGNPVRTIVLARLAPGADGVLRPVDEPPLRRGHYERIGDDWWRAAFDPRRKAPASEPTEGWSARMPTLAGHVDEARPLRLELDGLRIVWGLPEVDAPAPPPLVLPASAQTILERARAGRRTSPRAAAIAASLARVVAERFDGWPPTTFDRAHRPGALDEVAAADGTAGFAFALDGMHAPFVQHLPGAFRFRETELFLALRDVVRAESLAPAVHWLRRDGLWVFNLWEPRRT